MNHGKLLSSLTVVGSLHFALVVGSLGLVAWLWLSSKGESFVLIRWTLNLVAPTDTVCSSTCGCVRMQFLPGSQLSGRISGSGHLFVPEDI